MGPDNINHNKLRFYYDLKGCFKRESYIDLVPNWAQRSDLTGERISSCQIALEVLRYQRPKVPENEKFCRYCRPSGSDNHLEGLIVSSIFSLLVVPSPWSETACSPD